MTGKQALRGSIKRWEEYCFNGNTELDCELCNECNMNCKFCPLGIVGLGCIGRGCSFNGNPYKSTRESREMVTRNPMPTDGDYQMLFTLYMLYHEYYG